jgi:hypothetical protein
MKCKKKQREGKIIEQIQVVITAHNKHNVADAACDDHDVADVAHNECDIADVDDEHDKSSVAKERWHQTLVACSDTIASDHG